MKSNQKSKHVKLYTATLNLFKMDARARIVRHDVNSWIDREDQCEKEMVVGYCSTASAQAGSVPKLHNERSSRGGRVFIVANQS